jgi:VanZ family protein
MARKSNLLWGRLLVLLGWMTLIFLGSHQEGSDSARLSSFFTEILHSVGITQAMIVKWHLGFFVRKAAHFTEFLVLTLLLLWTIPDNWGRKRAAFAALSIAVFYAMTDEFHQSFIPNRTPALFDVGVDAAGSLLGLMMYGSARWFFEGKEA